MNQTLPLPVTLYSKPGCVQCTAVKRYLNEHNIDYMTFDVSVDEKALEVVRGLGYQAVPVTVVPFGQGESTHFYGFDPLKLAEIQR